MLEIGQYRHIDLDGYTQWYKANVHPYGIILSRNSKMVVIVDFLDAGKAYCQFLGLQQNGVPMSIRANIPNQFIGEEVNNEKN